MLYFSSLSKGRTVDALLHPPEWRKNENIELFVLRIAEWALIALSVTGTLLGAATLFSPQSAPWGPITVITGLILNTVLVIHAWRAKREPVRQFHPYLYLVAVILFCVFVGYWILTGLMGEALFSYMTLVLAMALHVIRLSTPRLRAHWAN